MMCLDPESAVTLACRSLLGAEAIQATCLSRALRSAVYRVVLHDHRTVIVKLHHGESRWKAVKERQAMQAVAVYTTLRTATILACGPVPGHDTTALITTDLGETSLSRPSGQGTGSRSQTLKVLGAVLAQFHQLPARCGPPAATGGLSLAEQVTALRSHCPEHLLAATGPALRRAVELTGTATSAGRLVWCHGDMHPGNVLLRHRELEDSAAYVIDFEQMVRAVPEYDVAQSAVTSDALDGNELAEIAIGYRTPLSADLVAVLIVFHVLRGWVYAALAEHRDTRLWATRLHIMINRYAVLR
jgi:Ser/Thr protein kinase RdoA (MazF antagonist)